MQLNKFSVKKLINEALQEDIGSVDITTDAIIPFNVDAKGVIIAKEPCIVAGIYLVQEVFKTLDKGINFETKVRDGGLVKKGRIVARVSGKARSILTAERVALNFLSHLSGIATITNRYVKAVGNTHVKILDTRKTLPGLRLLEKYAVRIGGGFNHRSCLDEQVLIKDNHLKFISPAKSCDLAANKYCNKLIEVEVDTLKAFESVLNSSANVIMLDNMSITDMKKAVALRNKFRKHILLEASGGVTIKSLRKIARTGVDFISVGALTHGAKSVDFSLDIVSICKNKRRL